MTRILYWNVQNFSLPKIVRFDSMTDFVQAASRLRHIVEEVISPQAPLPANSPPPPDIIVIVEVYSRTMEVSYQGNVLNATGNVGRGVLWLLDEIRHALGNTWCVVPPLVSGDYGFREAVAVYYNAASLTFTGPYVWATNAGVDLGRPALGNLGNLANYSQRWLDALPNPNNIIPALQLNRTWAVGGANVNEWQGAGQWEHYLANGTRIDFPYANSRSPFYTRLLDTTGRTIKLFAVHTSPASAVAATNRLADITDIAVGANEVGVVVGDFNVDSFNPNVQGAYIPLLNAGYDFLLDPRDPATTLVNLARRPYCLTHLLPPAIATPYNATGVAPDPQHNVYPRFGYMGSRMPHNPMQGTDAGAIDNVFVSYPPGAAVPAANTTIVNTVVGKPYTAGPAPAGVTADLTGGYGYNPSLANPVPVPAGVNATAGRGLFPDWNNFQRITSVSDHLAIVFDV